MPTTHSGLGSHYASLAPDTAPSMVMVPVQEGLDLLRMYTQNMLVLMTPEDKCLLKALEWVEKEGDEYTLEVSIFRHDLTQSVAMEPQSFDEVDALINGIAALAQYLKESFNRHGLFIGQRLAYTYDKYIPPGMLLMSKFMYYNGNNINDTVVYNPNPSPVAILHLFA